MPWKKQDGDARAVQGRDAIYLSGQLSHDNRGNIVGLSDRQTQMRPGLGGCREVFAKHRCAMYSCINGSRAGGRQEFIL
jgi:hypothetical protein